ncbi:AI-2E family transporter [Candidatus Gracilibacteria bacterium]|nr:AI-2E family transporter [Candidatus Gracilibacteria bacterium]
MLRKLLPLVFSSIFFEKLFAFGFLLLVGYILSDFLILFFITFLFAYLFLETGSWLTGIIHDWGLHAKRHKAAEIALRYNNTNIVVTILYVLFIAILIFLFTNIVPQIIKEMGEFISGAPKIASQIQNFVDNLQKSLQIDIGLNSIVGEIVNTKNLEIIGQTSLGYLKNTGIILTKFIVGLILSYIFVMERKPISLFLSQIKQGNFSFIYREYAIIAQKITHGFGVIIRAQSLIAFVNAVLTSIGLLIISFLHGGSVFPYIFTLSLIVLVFGFIPVFGTFISGVPILIIAYGYGVGTNDSWLIITSCILMIAVVHAVEAYYLNPRIVSSYVHIPVFVTFIILLLSEHFFGLIGLLVGVPLFIISLGFIEDIDKHISSIKQKLNAQ